MGRPGAVPRMNMSPPLARQQPLDEHEEIENALVEAYMEGAELLAG